MELKYRQKNQGFALIAFVIVLAIIIVWAAIYFKSGSQNSDKNMVQTGNRAIDQAKQDNAVMQQEGQQNQDMLNSLDAPDATTGHGALNQAQKAAAQQNSAGY